MNFNDFCSENENIENDLKNDKFKKYNENLHKNEQKAVKNSIYNANFNNFSKNSTGGNDNFSELNEKEIQEKISKYKNMNQSELMSELLKESAIQKQKGNLDDKKLTKIKDTMSNFITPEQSAKLDELIKMLRWYDK